MSVMATQYRRVGPDHFEPREDDPVAERRLRGELEKIDYTSYAANREILGQTLGKVTGADFQRLACAAAHARALWTKSALAAGAAPDAATIEQLRGLRLTFDELSEAYEGLRRLVERGYCSFEPS